MNPGKINTILKSKEVTEGAGVKLSRVFGFYEVPKFDPFLLLDHFKSDHSDDYMAGFPWHPHRGIETVTYMLKGQINHSDSLGNKGVIGPGDIQWMTAGSGIIHQEMPEPGNEGIEGFQLWVNLPASKKMSDPGYQEYKSESIPVVQYDGGCTLRLISGKVGGALGPVSQVGSGAIYLDVKVPARSAFRFPVGSENKVFAYIYRGSALMGDGQIVDEKSVVLFDNGEIVEVRAGKEPVHFLLVSGNPIQEKIAWSGPIVMNTDEELRIAFDDYQKGTFTR